MEEREHDEEGPPFAVASDWVRKQAARCTLHVRCTLAVPSFFQLFIIFLFSYFFGSSSNRCTSLDAYCTVVVQPRQRSTVHLFHSPELHTSLPGLPYPYSTVSVWPSESPPHAKKKSTYTVTKVKPVLPQPATAEHRYHQSSEPRQQQQPSRPQNSTRTPQIYYLPILPHLPAPPTALPLPFPTSTRISRKGIRLLDLALSSRDPLSFFKPSAHSTLMTAGSIIWSEAFHYLCYLICNLSSSRQGNN